MQASLHESSGRATSGGFVAGKELQAILEDLLIRVAGARGAILVDGDGVAIAQASRDAWPLLEGLGTGCAMLLREGLAAAQGLDQGSVTDVLLEAEGASVALIPLKTSCALCLLLAPDAIPGQSVFEARRAAAALDQAL
jgi:predicted regulator of Ras-like GTPase activity (Roadblock/LC7/MglB family)